MRFLAFLVSPLGVPTIAEWLVDKLHSAKFALRDYAAYMRLTTEEMQKLLEKAGMAV